MSRGFTVPAGRYARRLLGLSLATLVVLFSASLLFAAEYSEPARLAPRSLLLAIAKTGSTLVTVGDRGHILISKDGGRTWIQSTVPTRAMLTGVSFPEAQLGWAVGHDGVILHTADGGQTWERQDKGDELETSYLDVLFLDAQRGFIVGAYGKFLRTQDGGKTWQPDSPSDQDIHFNRLISAPGNRLVIAGESGSMLVSTDAGLTWNPTNVPYDGSLFGYVPVDENRGIVHGLRGHILTTADQGATWAPHHSEIKALIMGGIQMQSGAIVLAGQGGNFFISRDLGESFVHWKPADFSGSVAALAEADDGTLVAVGEAGAVRLTLPAP